MQAAIDDDDLPGTRRGSFSQCGFTAADEWERQSGQSPAGGEFGAYGLFS